MQEFDRSCVIIPYANYLFYGSHSVPQIVETQRIVYDQTTSFIQIKSNTYLFIHSGSGTININGTVCPLSRGSVVELRNYHLCSLIPNGPIDLSYCRFRNSSIYTLYNNPYFPHDAFKTLLEETCPVWQLRMSEIPLLESIWNAALESQETENHTSSGCQLFLIMEFLGRLTASKNAGRSDRTPSAQQEYPGGHTNPGTAP